MCHAVLCHDRAARRAKPTTLGQAPKSITAAPWPAHAAVALFARARGVRACGNPLQARWHGHQPVPQPTLTLWSLAAAASPRGRSVLQQPPLPARVGQVVCRVSRKVLFEFPRRSSFIKKKVKETSALKRNLVVDLTRQ
jgi:hypothetical protein